MRRSDLRGACLRGVDLTGADLFEADLREGAIAAVDRGKGLRLLEHVSRVAEAQGAMQSLAAELARGCSQLSRNRRRLQAGRG